MIEINKKIILLALGLAVAMLALPLSSVSATKPTEITGGFTMLDPILYCEMKPLGNSGSMIWTFTDAPFEIEGGIEGMGYYSGKWLVQNPFTPEMRVVANGVYYLEVEVNGAVGTLFMCQPFSGKIIITGGTGDLQNLHGVGAIEMNLATPEIDYTYSMNIHFDPN